MALFIYLNKKNVVQKAMYCYVEELLGSKNASYSDLCILLVYLKRVLTLESDMIGNVKVRIGYLLHTVNLGPRAYPAFILVHVFKSTGLCFLHVACFWVILCLSASVFFTEVSRRLFKFFLFYIIKLLLMDDNELSSSF